MLKLISLGAVVLGASAAADHPVNTEIVEDIKTKTTSWVPHDVETNPLANTSYDVLKGYLGTNIRGPQGFPQPPVANGLPSAFDARDKWGHKVHPIRDQQQCGSCWAFGATEAFSDRLAIATNGATDVILAPEDLVACDNSDMGCNGGWLSNAWNYLTTKGAVSDQCFPYTSGSGSVPQCLSPGTCANPEKAPYRKYKCQPGTIVEMTNPDELKTEIYTNGPIETAFSVYQDFFSYKSGVYHHVSGGLEGGHAIKVVGWGNEGGLDYWLCANSWGPNWGESGFFKIKQGDCGIDSAAYACKPQVNEFEIY
jgi:cathepsin B